MRIPHFVLVRIPLCSFDSVSFVEATGSLPQEMTDAIGLSAGPRVQSAVSQSGLKRIRLASRMSLRAAPFGAYAGTGMISVGDGAPIEILSLTVRSRVATDRIAREAIRRVDALPLADRPVRLNPLCYRVGAHWFGPKDQRSSSDTFRIRHTEAIAAVIEALGTGWMTVDSIASRLNPSMTDDRRLSLHGFIAALVDVGLLSDRYTVVGAGVDPFSRLRDIPPLNHDSLATTSGADRREQPPLIASGPVSTDLLQDQEAVWRSFVALNGIDDGTAENERFYTDLSVDLEGQLSTQTVLEIRQAATRLRELLGPSDPLSTLRDRFLERYGEAEVLLLECFHPEHGIDVPESRRESPLANACDISVGHEEALEEVPVPRFLLDLLPEVVAGQPSIDVGRPTGPSPALEAMCHAHLIDIDADGDLLAHLISYMGRSPLGLIGRFSFDRPDIAAACRAHLVEWEERAANDGYMIADVFIDVPGRATNVVQRGRLSSSVIDVWSDSSGNVPLADLAVSVVDGVFQVRRLSNGVRILPVVHSAHNFLMTSMPPIYRFLGLLSETGSGSWTWGALGSVPALPRVVSGRVLLSPASWHMSAEAVMLLQSAADKRQALFEFRSDFENHEWLGIELGDETLAFATSSSQQVNAAFHSMSGAVRIVEVPHVASPPLRRRAGGRHLAEVLIPGSTDPGTHSVRTLHAQSAQVLRRPPIGGVWSYWKVYCSRGEMDRVLESYATAIESFSDTERPLWFFVRYGDPHDHLRIRVLDASRQVRDAFRHVADELESLGLTWRVATDEYLPELLRYGGPSVMRAAERCFGWSSERAVALIRSAPSHDQRLMSTVADVVALASWLSAPEVDPSSFLRAHRNGLPYQFNPRGKGFQQLYRSLRAERDKITWRAETAPPKTIEELRVALDLHVRSADIPGVISSVIHMHVNRMIDLEPWRVEPLVCELAHRVIQSRYQQSGGHRRAGPNA